MTAPELPELPTTGIAVTDAEGRPATIKALTFDNGSFAVFDADQMHAFYRQGFAAGMEQERARATCDRAKGLGLGGSQAMQAVLYEASIKYNGRP
jgi:hypothetical protein